MADDLDAFRNGVAAKLRGQPRLIGPEAADVLRGIIAANGRDFGARYEPCCIGPARDCGREDDTGTLGESGDVDGLGLDAFTGPPLLDDGSIYLDTDPAPTPWGWGLGPITPTSIRLERCRH